MESEELLALRGEVKMQCFRAMNASEELEELLKVSVINYDRTDPAGGGKAAVAYTVDIWARIHSILSAAGIISRILWPSPVSEAPPKTRAARLRRDRAISARKRAGQIWATWTMPPRSALSSLENREVRNSFEHAENGATDWMAAFGKQSVRAYGHGLESSDESLSDSRKTFRYFFRDTWRLKIGDGECNLRAIVTAINALQASLPLDVQLAISGIQLRPVDLATSSPGIHRE